MIKEDPVLPPVQTAQDAFQGSYAEEYDGSPSHRSDPAENVTPYSEPDYKQIALAVFTDRVLVQGNIFLK